MIERFLSLANEESMDPVRLQPDILSSCKLDSANKALFHPCPSPNKIYWLNVYPRKSKLNEKLEV